MAAPCTGHSCIPVEVGRARAGDLLLALCHVEEHGLVRLWPLEIKALLDTIRCVREDRSVTEKSQGLQVHTPTGSSNVTIPVALPPGLLSQTGLGENRAAKGSHQHCLRHH